VLEQEAISEIEWSPPWSSRPVQSTPSPAGSPRPSISIPRMWSARPLKESSPQAARLAPPTPRNRVRPMRAGPGPRHRRQLNPKRRNQSPRKPRPRTRKPVLLPRPAARSLGMAPRRPSLPLFQVQALHPRDRRRRTRPPPHLPPDPTARDRPPAARQVLRSVPGRRRPGLQPAATRNPLAHRLRLPAEADRADPSLLRGRAPRRRRNRAGERHCWPGWRAV